MLLMSIKLLYLNKLIIKLHNGKINTNDCFLFLFFLQNGWAGSINLNYCVVVKKKAEGMAFLILLPSYVITRRKDGFGSR